MTSEYMESVKSAMAMCAGFLSLVKKTDSIIKLKN